MDFDSPLNIYDKEMYLAWLAKVTSYDLENGDSAVNKLVSNLYEGEPCSVVKRFSGSYNFCFQIRFRGDRSDMLLRFPIQGAVMNPWKKVEDESAVMQFIKMKTSIPIPSYHAHGIASGEFEGLGPFILMEFVHGDRLDEVLCSGDKFKPTITELQLEKIYKQIAAMYVQLWNLDFDRIGSLSLNNELMQWNIKSSPLTIKGNELKCHGLQIATIDNEPLSDASTYMTELIEQSVLRLWDKSYSITNADACREEYRALQSLKAITPEMITTGFSNGPFKLYNPDVRFGNMIVDTSYNIKAFIDWDFCYVAPAQFFCSPPLGITPFDMLGCSDDELYTFKALFSKFILVLKKEDEGLSKLMEQSMEDGTFWYNQAVQEAEFWSFMLKRLWTIKTLPEVEDPPDMAEFIRHKSRQHGEKWGAYY